MIDQFQIIMIVTFVHIWVKEEHIDDFIRSSILNHENSVKEPGNLRFDVLQDDKDPAKFVLYEAYESEEAAADHKKTSHYLAWRDQVADWMLKPREGIRHKIIAPVDKSGWN
jgi:autoinducer 2-degrading protein